MKKYLYIETGDSGISDGEIFVSYNPMDFTEKEYEEVTLKDVEGNIHNPLFVGSNRIKILIEETPEEIKEEPKKEIIKNKINMIDINKFPNSKDYAGYDLSSLDYHKKELEEKGIDIFIYWYAQGSYCGAGYALARKNLKWEVFSLSHCSCYGPLSHLLEESDYGKYTNKLSDFKKKSTKEYYGEIEDLIKEARKIGYK